MTRAQRFVSAFIVFHLAAITIGAIPRPELIEPTIPPDRSSLTALGRTLAPVLDALVPVLRRTHAVLWRATEPVRRPVTLYLGATKQYEIWHMFSRPARDHEYVHIRFYVATPGSNLLRVHRELVYPAHPEGQLRLIRAYADSFRDKAIALSLQRYGDIVAHELKHTHDANEATRRAHDAVVPVITAFARQYAVRNLLPGERLVRGDFWRGQAPTAPPGFATPPDVVAARREVLESYDAETDLGFTNRSQLPPVGATSRDADIVWTLLGEATWP
jgi:hypothetical protein